MRHELFKKYNGYAGTNFVLLSDICKFPSEFIRTPSNELFCDICSTVVNHVKQFFVEAHRNTAKHVRGIIQ